MARDLFRKEALETLDTPDQLDDLLRITSPRAWVALATLIVLLVLALIWGFLGSIPEESKGSGILMLEGGTFTMEAQVRGLVQDIYVQEGDHVTAGAAIARVTQPEQLLKVIKARDRLSKLKSKQAQLQKYSDSFGSMKSSSISSRQKNLEKSITALGNQMVWLQQRLANEEKVYRDGLIILLLTGLVVVFSVLWLVTRWSERRSEMTVRSDSSGHSPRPTTSVGVIAGCSGDSLVPSGSPNRPYSSWILG